MILQYICLKELSAVFSHSVLLTLIYRETVTEDGRKMSTMLFLLQQLKKTTVVMPTETRSRRSSCSNTSEKPVKSEQQSTLARHGLLQLNKERKKDFKKMLKNRKRAGQFHIADSLFSFENCLIE